MKETALTQQQLTCIRSLGLQPDKVKQAISEAQSLCDLATGLYILEHDLRLRIKISTEIAEPDYEAVEQITTELSRRRYNW